jgi:hypothetical protein
VAGLTGEAAAQKLRGRVGTTVTVKLVSVNSGYTKHQTMGFWKYCIYFCHFLVHLVYQVSYDSARS